MPAGIDFIGRLVGDALTWLLPGYLFDHVWTGGWANAMRWMQEMSS